MAKKTFTNETLSALVSKTKDYVNNSVSTKANIEHSHEIDDISNLQSTLANYATTDSLSELAATVLGKADSSHSHDDIYYTETEVDNKLATKADSSHNHTGVYDANGAAASALTSANAYTDSKIDALVGEGASTTLDTIGEISSAIEDNQDAIDLLNAAIANKANASDLISHTGDTTIHITSAERNSWNAKSNFSGNYNDLTNKPSIPSIDGLAAETYVDDKVGAITAESIGALPNTTVIPTVPTNVSAFTNDAGYLTEHQSLDGLATETYVDTQIDAIVIPDALSDLTTDSTHRVVTDAEKATWNAKSNFSGNYNDLTDKPSIPSISGLATETYVDEAVSTKANSSHTHDDRYYTETEINTKLSTKSDSTHNHNSSYDVLGAANTALVSAKEYTDDAIADEVIARDTAIATAKSSAISTASSDATTKANNALASAKTYTDSAVATVKNDLLNGAGTAYDTLKELGDLIDDNTDAIEALEAVAAGKANASHTHTIANVTGLQSALDGKAAASHGTHVSYSTTAPVIDGTASVGTAATVARSDHKHPTDTSRASKTEFDTHVSDTTKHITSTERTNWGAAYTHSQSAHAPSNAEKNQNAFSYVKVGTTSVAADTATDTLTLVAGANVTITPDVAGDSITISATDTNTTYSAGTGISLSGTTFNNSGVRSIATGTSNGTISVNTNGTSANVAVKGLGSAAYTASTAYDAAGTAQTKADAALASAKAYTDEIKDDLLNGAGAAYDTLKELGDLIDVNVDAIDALEAVAANKANASDLTSHTSNKSNPHGVTLAQLGVTATASELNKMDGITATTAELNILDGVTATTAELNYVDGVTSNIQVQLDGKANSSHNHSASNITSGTLSSDRLPTVPIAKGGTGATTAAAALTNLGITATAAELNKMDGVTATTAELNYVDGVTSNIQTQLNGKAASSHSHSTLSVQSDNYKQGTDLPSTYPRGETIFFSNNPTNKFNGMSYCTIHTIKGYNNMVCIQFAYPYNTNADTIYYRTAFYNTDVWREWKIISVSDHTHNYAGSSSAGGAATSANKLNTDAGSATQPVYFANGVPVQTTYTLGKSVPSNAVFTDTNTKVTNTLATTTKAYVTGTTSATTNTGTQVFDTGVYLDTTAGKLTATTFNGTTFSGSGVATVSEVETYLGI